MELFELLVESTSVKASAPPVGPMIITTFRAVHVGLSFACMGMAIRGPTLGSRVVLE